MRLMLRHKVIGLPVLAAILPVLAMFVLTFMEKSSVTHKIEGELDLLARDSMKGIAIAIRDTCQVTSHMIQKDVDRRLEDGDSFFSALGGLSLGFEEVSWTAVNQFTGEEKKVSLPKMLIDGVTWLGQNERLDESTPVIDDAKMKFGGDYAIFQRMNEKGDMIQVATTLPTQDGHRATGSYIPATTQGISVPVVSTVLQGKTYKGLAEINKRWYVSGFKPISDKTGKIIGMLFTGIPDKIPDSLRQVILNMKVGKTGYVYVLGGRFPHHRGHYIISKDGERDGENIWDSKDANGRYYIQDIINKATALKGNEVVFERYPWRNIGEDKDRWKVVAVTYFEPWDWVIGAGAYEEDYYDARQKVEASMSHMLWVMILSGLAVLIPIVGIALFFGNRITRRLIQITSISRKIAKGDLSAAAAAVRSLAAADDPDGRRRTDDETGHLLSSIKTMTENLNALVGQVQRSGIQVTSSSTQLAATAKEQETTMANQVASTNKVVRSIKEISEVAARLVETMEQVASKSQDTAGFATKGQTDLARMEAAMQHMETASRSISGRLETINEKAENITNVVTTITKVADQTNLLSLNAAIEAEKAGEYGRGFNVVAREIRRLADQTAVATLDIDKMVQEMQSAVSAGVMEMDKFIAEVNRSAEDVGRISVQLARIIEQVQALSPDFENVNVAMGRQSENAQKINSSITSLSEEIQMVTESLHESFSAIEQLNDAARGLQNQVSRFKVS
ncbi:MAG: methyl-accepting chemotaxis protein [Deltaproteobacteria bacterium]|nr:methyl-accepting chemotaxis protein [Deltaproteobacteria bacterium]